MMKNKYYELEGKSHSYKLALLSDIHYCDTYDLKILDDIIDNIKSNKPDYICVAGDIVDETNYCDNIFLNWFEKLSKTAPVIVSLGGHDLIKKVAHKAYFGPNKEWFKKLNALDNVEVLDNRVYEDNQIRFIGYTQKYDIETDRIDDTPEEFIKGIKKLNFKIDNSKFNVLMCHSPQNIMGKTKNKNNPVFNNNFFNKIDLVLSGHMHNGLIPPLFDNIFKNNYGLVSPEKTFFPKYSRGIIKIHNKNRTNLIISGGIIKFSKGAPNYFHPFNVFYKPQIDYIKITKEA